MMKKNVPVIGFVLGLILPMIGLLLVYLLKFRNVTVEVFLKSFFSDGKIAAKILTLSLLANLAPFIYYTNKRMDQAAKGVFAVTMIYVVFILGLMYVW